MGDEVDVGGGDDAIRVEGGGESEEEDGLGQKSGSSGERKLVHGEAWRGSVGSIGSVAASPRVVNYLHIQRMGRHLHEVR